jgi:hypothetical protein
MRKNRKATTICSFDSFVAAHNADVARPKANAVPLIYSAGVLAQGAVPLSLVTLCGIMLFLEILKWPQDDRDR